MTSLTPDQLRSYADDGYLLCDAWFSPYEIDLMRAQLPLVYSEESPRRVLEKGGTAVRSVYGSHASNELFGRLIRHPRVLGAAQEILRNDVHVYQFKINAKASFVGDVWEWHQDYVFWREEDGMATPDVVTAAVFLDDVTEFNGPMMVIPGSHRHGVLSATVRDERGDGAYGSSPAWIANLIANLKYSLDRDTIARLTAQREIVAPKGARGSVLFFHANLAHASGPNLSPTDRNIVMITYNSVTNRLPDRPNPRPEFLASRSYEPLTCLDESALCALALS